MAKPDSRRDRAARADLASVCATAEHLQPEAPANCENADWALTGSVQRALDSHAFVPRTLTATAQDGVVTLTGVCNWDFERDAAGRAARYASGVVNVLNSITLAPETSLAQVQAKLDAALQRHPQPSATLTHVPPADCALSPVST